MRKNDNSATTGRPGDPLRDIPLEGASTQDIQLGSARPEEAGDARLVELAKHGDDRAFAILVQRYERALIRVLSRLVHDEELARDLAQETFWRVYCRLEKFDISRRFGPWLYRVGVNLALDVLRRHGPPSTISIDSGSSDSRNVYQLTDPDPRVRDELAQEVRHVLERIPSTYRVILVLKDLEGFSTAEVATIVNRREATIRWRLARARELFRDIWERRQSNDSARGF
jgi:RNA polymerase sigma-70 factor (ECF subfamily)